MEQRGAAPYVFERQDRKPHPQAAIPSAAMSIERLTERRPADDADRMILTILTQGKTVRETAERLGFSFGGQQQIQSLSEQPGSERTILNWLTQGNSVLQLAERLGLSVGDQQQIW